MKNIIYFNQDDAEKFDYDRFKKSLNDYAKVPDADIKAALKTLDQYENLHVSRLVETGTFLIANDGNEMAAKKYYDAHDQYFGDKFERLRRITGYLVGTLDRWNDGKKAEEKARVKHSINSAVDDKTRAERLEQQAVAHNIAYATA